jgi:hypothetical protein
LRRLFNNSDSPFEEYKDGYSNDEYEKGKYNKNIEEGFRHGRIKESRKFKRLLYKQTNDPRLFRK